MKEYQDSFKSFVLNKLPGFYEALGNFYFERGGTRDSLSYFYNHFARFEAMIKMCVGNGIDLRGLNFVCELGSWYPYTTYYFKMQKPSLYIDLYDIIVRELKIESYDVDGIRLIDFNLCTERLPDVTYDLIILSEVLEHLPIDQFAFEKEVIRLMDVGSYLVVTYPLGGRNAKDYDLNFTDRDLESLQEDHVREYTRQTTELFFTDLVKISEQDIWYKAYGDIRICLYQR